MKKTPINLKILDFVKKNYSDKSFFTSKEFKKRVVNLAKMVTNRYKNNANYFAIGVSLFWNEEDDTTAYTDNNTVTINMATDLLKNTSKPERALGVWGLLAHELGHCLHTDFKLFHRFMDIENGFKNLFENPEKVWDFKSNMQEQTYEYFVQHIVASMKILKEINNVLEDPFIEYKIIQIYTGSFKRYDSDLIHIDMTDYIRLAVYKAAEYLGFCTNYSATALREYLIHEIDVVNKIDKDRIIMDLRKQGDTKTITDELLCCELLKGRNIEITSDILPTTQHKVFVAQLFSTQDEFDSGMDSVLETLNTSEYTYDKLFDIIVRLLVTSIITKEN